jgi:hypothetical protein
VIRPRGPKENIIAIAVVKAARPSGRSTHASIAVRSQRGSRPRDRREREEEAHDGAREAPPSVASQRLFQKDAQVVLVGRERRPAPRT